VLNLASMFIILFQPGKKETSNSALRRSHGNIFVSAFMHVMITNINSVYVFNKFHLLVGQESGQPGPSSRTSNYANKIFQKTLI
jgi:hypothetical protein